MTLDPDVARLIEASRTSSQPGYDEMPVAEARALYRTSRLAAGLPAPAVAERQSLNAEGPHGLIPLRLYRPHGVSAGPLPVIVYFHGGGWVLGDLDVFESLCCRLANASVCAVASVDYRLAPEHKFPKAVDDAYAAVQWIGARATDLNIDATRLAVAGDSAGGNLAAVVCLLARDKGGPAIAYQILLYPVTDASMGCPSYERFGAGYLLTRESMAWFYDCYAPQDIDRTDFRLSPLAAQSLAGLPPALVLTAGFDPLRDEGECYAQRLAAEANVPVTLWRVAGQVHGFLPMSKQIAAAGPVIDKVGRIVGNALGAVPRP